MATPQEIIARAEAGNDKPQIATVRVRILSLTVQEVREICDSNATHPLAATLAHSVRDFQPTEKVNVEKTTVQAIAENGTVAVHIEPSAEGPIITKEVIVSIS